MTRVYTVVGFDTDDEETIVEWIVAESPNAACNLIIDQDPSVRVVQVFEGKRKGLLTEGHVIG